MRVRALPCICVLVFVSLGVGWTAGLRVNLTPSAEIGIWRIEPVKNAVAVGDRVFICPPATELFKAALHRGYLRHGHCPGGLAPLIKTVAAVAGQKIHVGKGVVIDGHQVAASVVQAIDGNARTIVPYGGGIVPTGHLFVLSPMAMSYDSRYFGPIPAAGLLGRARPVIAFKP